VACALTVNNVKTNYKQMACSDKKQHIPKLCVTFYLLNTKKYQMLNSIILRHIKMQPFCLQYRPQHIPFECMLSITTLKDIFYEKNKHV